MEKIVLGVDIGGSHITATLVDLETGKLIESSQVREAVNAKGSLKDIISLWGDVIRRAFSSRNIEAKKVGIAVPGPFDYSAGIALMKNQDKYDSLYGHNVKNLLAQTLDMPSTNFRFLNDAESFLKGEVFSGAAKGASIAIGLTLGTGLGSSLYKNSLVEDADLWHLPFKDGIAEDYLSTRWFVARYFVLTGKSISGVKELAELANEEPLALATFKEFGRNLALFLKEVIRKEEPEIIVVGGNISKAFHLFSTELNKLLDNGNNKPVVQKAILGEEASLIGAASCWTNREEEVYIEVA